MKPRIIKAFDKLDTHLHELLKQKFPFGFEDYLISFTEKEGKYYKALPFETEEFSYLIKIDASSAPMFENNFVEEKDDLEEASLKIAEMYEKNLTDNYSDDY